MSAIIIRDQSTNEVVHRIDTSNLSERQRERAFDGVAMKTDLDRFYLDEED